VTSSAKRHTAFENKISNCLRAFVWFRLLSCLICCCKLQCGWI